ncbi:MAG TPA: hypothetical protein VL068_02990, partial [Microthrixaceae bacterium]|nr:hypothetical protein [Microthrixaceae bacterium]
MAVNLGRHAGMVAAIGLVFTIVVGAGITRLEFATGQDSYLNSDSQIYKDNVAYQKLFGGQAMLSSIVMEGDAKVEDLFTPEGRKTMETIEKRLYDIGVLGVISPATALEFSNNLSFNKEGDITKSIAGEAQLRAIEVTTDTDAKALRATDALETAGKAASITPEKRTLDNPEWVKFLLYDNQGEIRSALRSAFPDSTHAQMVVRMPGNLSIEAEGALSDKVMSVT